MLWIESADKLQFNYLTVTTTAWTIFRVFNVVQASYSADCRIILFHAVISKSFHNNVANIIGPRAFSSIA